MTATVTSDQRAIARRAQRDPEFFATHILGVKPWAKQREILRAVREHPRVGIRSCHGAGKSFILAIIALWFGTSHDEAVVMITARTWGQALSQIWAEARRLYANAVYPLGGEMQATRWQGASAKQFIRVYSPKEVEAAGGQHARNILQIVDEASGLTALMAEAFEGNMSGGNARIVLSGNPLRPSGPFYDAFHGRMADRWQHVHINAYEVAEQGLDSLTNAAWIEDRRIDWGEGTPAWQSRVLGEFPDAAEDSLISLAVVQAAEELELEPKGIRRMGVDIARFGGDETVIIVRNDTRILWVEAYRGVDLMSTVGRIQAAAKEWSVEWGNVSIDDAGMGGGVTDRLMELGRNVSPVNFGEGADDSEQFANRRAECYWRLKAALESGSLSLMDAGPAIGGQLAAIRKDFTSKGQIKLEPKDEIKKRTGRSPDHADALALTFGPVVRAPYIEVLSLDDDEDEDW